jgi:hypothetical protein
MFPSYPPFERPGQGKINRGLIEMLRNFADPLNVLRGMSMQKIVGKFDS